MDELLKILERVTGPGDLAAALSAGVAGFLLDAGLDFIGFLPAEETGVVFALAALGLKKLVEVSSVARRNRKAREQQQSRAARLAALLESDQRCPDLVERLARERQLAQAQVIEPEDFKHGLDEIINTFRERSQRRIQGE